VSKEWVDDLDKSASIVVYATPRRASSSLDAVQFQEWLALSDSARVECQKIWNTYGEGYWHELLEEAANRFRSEFGRTPHVLETNHGVYHGGTLIIGVVTDLPYPKRVEIPAYYVGFPVMQFSRSATSTATE
jgi:hypothetical protein